MTTVAVPHDLSVETILTLFESMRCPECFSELSKRYICTECGFNAKPLFEELLLKK